MTTAKTKSKQLKPKAPAPKPVQEDTLDARGHKPGSRKSKVHEVWEKQDEATAFTLGRRLQLKDQTLRSWFGVWRRAAGKSAAKPAVKAEKKEKVATKPAEVTAQVTVQ